MRHVRFSIAGFMGFVVAFCVGLVSLRYASEPAAGGILLLTLGGLCLAILGAVYRRGARRAFWLGFALFGWGYMTLASQTWWDRKIDRPELLTTRLLNRLHPLFQIGRGSGKPLMLDQLLADPRNSRIERKLDEPISMSFPNETPLQDVLNYITQATEDRVELPPKSLATLTDPDPPSSLGTIPYTLIDETRTKGTGIPIYVDPAGLQKAHQTVLSTITMDFEGVPLRTTLRLLLRQLGLRYEVGDGLLTITSGTAAPVSTEPYLRIGHCLFALLAAWIGAVASCRFYSTREEPARDATSLT